VLTVNVADRRILMHELNYFQLLAAARIYGRSQWSWAAMCFFDILLQKSVDSSLAPSSLSDASNKYIRTSE